jgi:hypothetical protein
MVGTYIKESLSLNLFDNSDNEPIKSLFDSILRIDSSFLHYVKDGFGAKQNCIIEHVERVFAYELYKQWSENTFVKRNGLKVNAEISKQFYSTPESKKVKLCYPDMILHSGQEANKNLMVCEIKRFENIKMHRKAQTKDLNSLGYFLDPRLKVKDNIVEWKAYKYGVYILVGNECDIVNQNKSIMVLKEHIYQPKFDVPREHQNKILCLAYNGDCQNLYYATLDELIK